MSDDVNGRRLTGGEREELDHLRQTLRSTTPKATRRDVLRWSAIAAGAVATARFGIGAAAAPQTAEWPAAVAYQAAEIVKNAQITVPFDSFGQPVTLDPHRSIALGGFWVLFPNVWGGLLRYDEVGNVQLDLAESYTKSDDGLTYTFKIRPDAKYANGHHVVASHFIASWQRALNPTNLSPMASFMSPLKGFQDYVSGKSTQLGIKAVDDATVQVTLDKAYSFFPSYMAAFVWDVVDPDAIQQYGDNDFPLKDAGTGPWRFTSFQPDSQLVMLPNPHHYDGVSPSIAQITWALLTGPTAASTALNMYKSNQAVSADVPLSLKSSVEQDPTLSKELVKIASSGFTQIVQMDFKQPPFDDVRVRRAFAMGIDRAKWAKDIWQDTFTPTEVFTPPVVTTLSGYKPPSGLKFDAGAAKKLLNAVYKSGQGIPQIVYYEAADASSDDVARTKAFLQLFKDALGVEVKLDTSKTSDQIQALNSDSGGVQFAITEWQNITETPHLMSDVFKSTSTYMKGVSNWSATLPAKGGFDPGADAKHFDGLMTQADIEQDEAKRNDLYKQGETILLNDAVCIPLGNWVQMYVQKPWLKGTKQGTWTGRLPVWFNKDVVVVKH